ncbi:MAG: hypothetical protein KC657_26650 [Myxococcales bacterium]|nr:hypothetical protein [Myxococcales bacterium]
MAKSRYGLVGLTAAVVMSALAATGGAEAADNTLKDLMKQVGRTVAGGDAKALAPLFAKTKTLAPSDPAFSGWGALADKGKAAADAGDLAAAKATCKECHDKYRGDYKKRFGSKAP